LLTAGSGIGVVIRTGNRTTIG